jgi:flagellar assembly protein FliH
MFLSRRLSRDGLHAEDVRPYGVGTRIPTNERSAIREQISCNSELESLDLVNLGPYLLLLEAGESAQRLISCAEAQADLLRQQAQAEGAARAREEAKQEALPAAMAFANAGQALIIFEEQMIARYTPEMVRLAVEIAEKLVHKAVTAEPEIVAEVLQRARQEVTDARHLRIRLNPKDYQLLAEIRPDVLTLGQDAGRRVEIVQDPELARGGCTVETEIGLIDATLPTQMTELRRQLLDQESLVAGANPIAGSQASTAMSREL